MNKKTLSELLGVVAEAQRKNPNSPELKALQVRLQSFSPEHVGKAMATLRMLGFAREELAGVHGAVAVRAVEAGRLAAAKVVSFEMEPSTVRLPLPNGMRWVDGGNMHAFVCGNRVLATVVGIRGVWDVYVAGEDGFGTTFRSFPTLAAARAKVAAAEMRPAGDHLLLFPEGGCRVCLDVAARRLLNRPARGEFQRDQVAREVEAAKATQRHWSEHSYGHVCRVADRDCVVLSPEGGGWRVDVCNGGTTWLRGLVPNFDTVDEAKRWADARERHEECGFLLVRDQGECVACRRLDAQARAKQREAAFLSRHPEAKKETKQ